MRSYRWIIWRRRRLGSSSGWRATPSAGRSSRGGSQNLAETLGSYLGFLGGEIVTGWRVESLDELPAATVVLLDVTPRQLIRIAGDRLPAGYVRRLGRYRYGAGVFKLDWALAGPIPWRSPECSRAGTVHLGGTLDEIADIEAAVGRGEHPERPFVLLSQPSLFDPSRAPAGRADRLGLLPRPERLDRGHDRSRSRPRSSGSPPDSASSSSRGT